MQWAFNAPNKISARRDFSELTGLPQGIGYLVKSGALGGGSGGEQCINELFYDDNRHNFPMTH